MGNLELKKIIYIKIAVRFKANRSNGWRAYLRMSH